MERLRDILIVAPFELVADARARLRCESIEPLKLITESGMQGVPCVRSSGRKIPVTWLPELCSAPVNVMRVWGSKPGPEMDEIIQFPVTSGAVDKPPAGAPGDPPQPAATNPASNRTNPACAFTMGKV